MKILNFIFLIIFFISCSHKSQQVKTGVSLQKIEEIKKFVKDKNYNQDLAIFIDFKIPANQNRFFIVDLAKSKIVEKGLVSHGSGSIVPNSKALRFSNIEGSYQSSLGKYEMKESYVGQFGKAYRMDGLDVTNNNARERAIVLHYFKCVPDKENGEDACLSLGCPMLSKNFFTSVAKYLDSSKKTIILYAYY